MANQYNDISLTLDWDKAFSVEGDVTGGVIPATDALVRSIANYACVNLDYIAELTGADKDRVIDSLNGLIYQNPKTWNGNPCWGANRRMTCWR